MPFDPGPFQPSPHLMLRFYSLFKQATEGKCSKGKPAFWAVIEKAKWDAWKALGNMPKEEAMSQYVEELKQVISHKIKLSIIYCLNLYFYFFADCRDHVIFRECCQLYARFGPLL